MKLERILQKILLFFEGLLLLLGLLLFGYLLYGSLQITGYNQFQAEKIYLYPDKAPGLKLVICAGSLLAVLILTGVADLVKKKALPGFATGGTFRSARRILFWVTFLGACLGGIWWILHLHQPFIIDDTAICWSAAEQILHGDYAGVVGHLGYVTRYPQQIGIVCLDLLFLALRGSEGSLPAFYFFNLILYLLTFCFGTVLIRRWLGERARPVATLLWITGFFLNIPLLLYVCYMYGETAFNAGVILGMLCLLGALGSKTVRSTAGKILCCAGLLAVIGVTVFLRKNALILVIAIGIAVILQALYEKRYRYLILIPLLAAAALFPAKIARDRVQAASGLPYEAGMTPSMHMIMGLMDEWAGPGWYNNRNQEIYFANDGDPKAGNSEAMELIRERIAYYREAPDEFRDFMERKIQTQWFEPSYDSLFCTMSTTILEGHADQRIINKVVFHWDFWWDYLDVYQTVIYMGAFLYVLLRSCTFYYGEKTPGGRRHIPNFTEDTLILFVMGSFLFSLMWEAKSRYMAACFTAMLPMAVLGYYGLSCVVIRWCKKGFEKRMKE